MNRRKTFDSFVQQWISNQEIQDNPVHFSVIIPAYNEERRLPPTLIDMIDYFDSGEVSYELIIVDDGSRDRTSDVVQKFARIRPQIRLIRLPKNYGKGHAVRTGVLNAGGRYVLFADADGSTPIAEIERLYKSVKSEHVDIAAGSRAIHSDETSISTVWYRRLLGRSFNFFVNFFLLPGFKDTQCGFKMFSAPAARFIFERQESDGFSFDIELLFIARQVGLSISEVPINWENVPGSKVNLILDAMKMFRDIFIFKLRHRTLTPEDYDSFLDDILNERSSGNGNSSASKEKEDSSKANSEHPAD